eukprot:scaffold79777_cov20-Tisochrysis_lutea.AAC.1
MDDRHLAKLPDETMADGAELKERVKREVKRVHVLHSTQWPVVQGLKRGKKGECTALDTNACRAYALCCSLHEADDVEKLRLSSSAIPKSSRLVNVVSGEVQGGTHTHTHAQGGEGRKLQRREPGREKPPESRLLWFPVACDLDSTLVQVCKAQKLIPRIGSAGLLENFT